MKNDQEGYIALVSAIVISILLISITVIIGMNNFFARFNILDSESKERSLALAEGCADEAIFKINEDASYNPSNEVVPVGSDSCTIVSVQADTPSVGETTIKTQATINKSYTNLKVIVNNTDFTITSWSECPTLSSC